MRLYPLGDVGDPLLPASSNDLNTRIEQKQRLEYKNIGLRATKGGGEPAAPLTTLPLRRVKRHPDDGPAPHLVLP